MVTFPSFPPVSCTVNPGYGRHIIRCWLGIYPAFWRTLAQSSKLLLSTWHWNFILKRPFHCSSVQLLLDGGRHGKTDEFGKREPTATLLWVTCIHWAEVRCEIPWGQMKRSVNPWMVILAGALPVEKKDPDLECMSIPGRLKHCHFDDTSAPVETN